MGVPLDATLARMMAGGLGVDAADLAPICLHHDPGAWALAARFGQPVYAEGNDVFFQKGAYNPGTVQGRNLLGRQLARTPAVRAAQHLRAAATYPASPAQASAAAHVPAAAPHAPVVAAPHVPRGGDDRSTLVNELTRLAEQPGSGYALFTVLLGSDPLTGRAVPRPDDATLATEIVRFVPNGATYLPALRANGGLTQFVATMTDHAHLAYFVTPGLASGLAHAVAAFLANPESWWEQALDHTPWHSLTQAADEFFQRLFTTYLMAVQDVARNAGPAVFGAIGAAAQGALTAVGHVTGMVGHAAGAVVRMVATFASGPVAVVERATGQWVVVVNGVVSPLEQAALAQAENAIKEVIGLQLTPLALPATLGRIAWDHLPPPLAKTLVAECIGVCLRSIDLVGALAEGGLEFLGVIVEHGVIGFVRGLTALPPLQAVAILTRVAALLAQPRGAFAKGLLLGVGEGLRDNVLGLVDLVKGVLTLAGDIERSFGGLVRMLGDPTIARDLHTAATALQGELTGVAPLLVSSQGLGEARQVAEAIKGAVEPRIADLAETAGAQVATGLIAQLSGSDEHLGEVVGRIGGSVVFNVALSALTDGAFAVGRAALTALVDAARIATQGAHAGLLVAALQQWLPRLLSGLKVALTGLKGTLGQALERIVSTLEPVVQRLAALAGRAGDTNPAGKTMAALGAALGHDARDALLVDLTPNQVEGLLARLGSDGPALLKQMLAADRLTPLEIERLAGPGGGLDPRDLRDLLDKLGAGTVKTLLTALSPTEIKELVGALGPAAVTRLLTHLIATEIKAFLDAFGLDIATKFLDDLTAGEVRELIGLSDPRAIAQFKAAALRGKNVARLRSYLAGMRAKGKGSLQAGLIADAERAPKALTPTHPSGPAVASLPAAFAAEARAWRDAGLEESVARLLGRADLDLAFRQWMRDTLDVLNTARKDGRLADNKALRRLIGEMGGTGTDLATVGQDFSELENARYVLEHQALAADSPVVIGARPNQEWGTLPKIDVENVEADTYYRTAEGVVHLDEVKDTPNAFVSKIEQSRRTTSNQDVFKQFDRYGAWLEKGDVLGQKRVVGVVIRLTGPNFHLILEEDILGILERTVVRDPALHFFKVGGETFSMSELRQMYADAERAIGIKIAQNPGVAISVLLNRYFNTLEETVETIRTTQAAH